MRHGVRTILISATLGLQLSVTSIASGGQALPSPAQIYHSKDASQLTRSGLRYLRGAGVARDATKALHLFCNAARMGNAEAKYRLGDIYAFGRGVPRNIELGTAWLYQAAQEGDLRAKVTLKALGMGGVPRREPSCTVPRDETQAPGSGPLLQHHAARPLRLAGSGTGFVVNRHGTLITARHVIAGCRAIGASLTAPERQFRHEGDDRSRLSAGARNRL
jgi:S1-C subfamily serine protease